MNTKIRKIGNGYGILLPKQALEDMHVSEGSVLTLVQNENGLLLTQYDAEFEEQLAAFQRQLPKHRNSMRELAK